MKKFLIGLVVVATILQLNTTGTAQAASAPMLIRTANNPAVYFVSPRLQMKKLILNEEVFKSYGNTWSQVKIVDQKTLDKYPDISAVKVTGKPQVYLITSIYKYWLRSSEEFLKYNQKWNEILEINQTDLDSYIDTDEVIKQTAIEKDDNKIKSEISGIRSDAEVATNGSGDYSNYKIPSGFVPPACSEDRDGYKLNAFSNGYVAWADLCYNDNYDYCVDSTFSSNNPVIASRRVTSSDTACPR